MRYLFSLAALTIACASQVQASGQAYYPPLEYQTRPHYPQYATVSPYTGPMACGTHYPAPPGCLHSAPLFIKHGWGHSWYAPPPPPPGFVWHPYVRSPRDFFMMERP